MGLFPVADRKAVQSSTPPVPSIHAGIAGIELMQEIGIEETREHVLPLNAHLVAGVDELGGTVVTPCERDRHGALTCVESNGVIAHAYRSLEDIDLVLNACQAIRTLLANLVDVRAPATIVT